MQRRALSIALALFIPLLAGCASGETSADSAPVEGGNLPLPSDAAPAGPGKRADGGDQTEDATAAPLPDDGTGDDDDDREDDDSGDDGDGDQDDAVPGEPCAALSGPQALAENLHRVPANDIGAAWTGTGADIQYDPCATLSWITVTVDGATASSPCAIMLFHRGEYIGTASYIAFGFWPTVERVSDGELQATYRWPRGQESHAGASGRSVSHFTWSEAEQRVIHTGEFPPH